jgi:plasmid stability protein
MKQKQLKVSLPDELRARLDAASAKSGRSVAEEIRSRVEASFAEAADQPTHDFLRGVALMAAEIARETGAVWHKHPGAYDHFVDAIVRRLKVLKPQGSTAFGHRPHATVPDDDLDRLGEIVEFRLRRQPDFTDSPTRRLLEEEYQMMGSPRVLLDDTRQQQRKPDQPKKRGK